MTKMLKNFSAITILVLLMLPLLIPMTQAWTTSATTIASGSNDEIKPQIIADGGGGSIICWLEWLGGSNYHVKAQRLNSRGELQWSASGITLAASILHDGLSNNLQLCTDGAGGAFIVWKYGSADPFSIFVRRISSSGSLLWSAVQTSNAAGTHKNFDICSDEAGGVVIVWQDNREGNYNIYAQRIDSGGNKQWGVNGTVVIEWTDFQVVPQVISNGSGWYYVAWADRRSTEWDMYLQHLNSTGGSEWATGGLGVCTEASYQSMDDICSDGNGGVIMTWSDNRGPDYDIYAQRIAPNGIQFWGTDGKRIIGASQTQQNSKLCSDGANGTILIWEDQRGALSWDIYGQRLNSSGHDQWAANGTPIANEANEQQKFDICSDGAGGAFIIWEDARIGPVHQNYMQRVNASGYPLLGVNGTLVEPQISQWQYNPALAYITPGEVVMVWETDTGSDRDLFAQIYPERTTSGGGEPPIPGFTVVYLFAAVLAVVTLSRKKLLS